MAGIIHLGNPIVFLINSPIVTAMNTDSKPVFFIIGIVLIYCDRIDIIYITKNDNIKGVTFSPRNFAPIVNKDSIINSVTIWKLNICVAKIDIVNNMPPISVDKISSFLRKRNALFI